VALSPTINYKTEEAAYWLAQSVEFGTLVRDQGGRLGCSRLTMTFKRTEPTNLEDDLMAPGMWVAKIAGPEFSVIPVEELASVEQPIITLLTSLMLLLADDLTATQLIWHAYHEDLPRDKTGRGQKPGPAVRTTPINLPGNISAPRLPDQVACNSTWRTASRKHWGRTAWPGFASNHLQPDFGRWDNATVDTFANNVNDCREWLEGAGYAPGVWSQLHPAFLTTTQVGVDDVPDIVRRRRAKRVGHRSLH